MPTIRLDPGRPGEPAVDVVITARDRSGPSREGTASVAGTTSDFCFEPAAPGATGGGTLTIDGHRYRTRFVRDGDRLLVWIDGAVHRFTVASRTARRSGHSDADAARDELVAPMPGTILRILVRAGDVHEANAPLIIMESMKMEMTISAPKAGRVSAIACREGEMVAIDQVLLRREDVP
ncbi:MAG: hypothetical protein KF817_03895 [Phycisphaeraceae bacterium]|nr:hypothetical protein [Phycisphaeraceae bacterium]